MAEESYALDDCPNVVSAPGSSSKGLRWVERCSESLSGEAGAMPIPRPFAGLFPLETVLITVCGCGSGLSP